MDSISDNLAFILDAGWSPPRLWHDPVAWKRRELNVVADYLVNFTMDNEQTWCRSFNWPFATSTLDQCNLAAWSDGGTRSGKKVCSASAWIVEVGIYQNRSWHFRPLAMGGTYFAAPLSSFTVECFALQECASFLKHLIQRNDTNIAEPLGKRQRVN